MDSTKLLLIIGLTFNTLGAIVLLLPQLNPWKHISSELIVGEKKEEEKYIQSKDLQNYGRWYRWIYSSRGWLFTPTDWHSRSVVL